MRISTTARSLPAALALLALLTGCGDHHAPGGHAAGASAETERVEGPPGTVREAPILEVELLELEGRPGPGAEVVHPVRVRNAGAADGVNVVLTCTLSAGQTYLSSTGPTAATPMQDGVLRFAPLPALAPGAEAVWRVTALIEPGATDASISATLEHEHMREPVRR